MSLPERTRWSRRRCEYAGTVESSENWVLMTSTHSQNVCLRYFQRREQKVRGGVGIKDPGGALLLLRGQLSDQGYEKRRL